MSYQGILREVKKGPKRRCSVSGIYFYESEMVQDSYGRWVRKNLEQKDLKRSKYKKGPGWERRELL